MLSLILSVHAKIRERPPTTFLTVSFNECDFLGGRSGYLGLSYCFGNDSTKRICYELFPVARKSFSIVLNSWAEVENYPIALYYEC